MAAARETAPHRIELVVGPDDASVPATIAADVAAAVGEALTNVRKHARASRVVVSCEDLDRRAVTTVRDDRVGADPVVIRSGRGVSDSIRRPVRRRGRLRRDPLGRPGHHDRDPRSGRRVLVSTRVAIVDDFPLVLEGVAGVLNSHPGIHVVGCAQSAAEGMALAAEAQPDVVVLDLYMPDMSGIRMLAELRECMPEVKVLMVTASEKAHTLLDAVAAGASGYLTKRVSSRELCEAVLTVAAGGSVITPALAGHLLREYSRASRGDAPSPRVALTPSEQEVLAFIAQGRTDREIASEMHVSPRTVQNHLMRIREKTGRRRRSELTHWAVRNSVV